MIQFVDGKFWKHYADSLHVKWQKIHSERGTIYSEDGNILTASLPFYDIYIDFLAEQMIEANGKLFRRKLDSLSNSFATLFKDKSAIEYKAELLKAYKIKDRYYPFHKKATYQEFQQIQHFPFINLAKTKYSSGFMFEVRHQRIYLYGQLAKRTIGFFKDSASWNLGLEKAYDSVLRGKEGRRLMKSIAGGSYAPVNGHDIAARNGKDIISTLNMSVQDIAQEALEKRMQVQQAEWGTCIVMEVSTGKVKAMVNLIRRENDSNYAEDVSYAIKRYEPGSTFKLVSMMALLEDGFVTIDEQVDLNQGQIEYGKGVMMYDSEKHGERTTSIKNAFAMSSNVGVSRLVNSFYSKKPERYMRHLKTICFNKKTGFDLISEEEAPLIHFPKTKYWNNTTSLPWMSIGYGVAITPLQTLMLYNAVANGGMMMKPFLVSKIVDQGLVLQDIQPVVLQEQICKPKTLKQLQLLLEQVVDSGTAKKIFKNSYYRVAGKTGTNLFFEKYKGYKDSTYMSSFVGYFPADAPKYSCIVVIKNRPRISNYYGATVAAPVFKIIADRLMALDKKIDQDILQEDKTSLKQTAKAIKKRPLSPFFLYENNHVNLMPNLMGMNLIRVLELVEKLGLKIEIEGNGVVMEQSVHEGEKIEKNKVIKLKLG